MPKSTFAHASQSSRKGVVHNAAADIAHVKKDYRQVIQRAQADPGSLTSQDVLTLQRSIGNRATVRLMHPILQAKLKLGPAGDKYEQEADRVAAQVVGGAQTSGEGGAVQRDLEDEEMIQGKEMHGPEGGEVDASVQGQIQATQGGGKPLDENVRRQMEQGFGADFSGVRVHTGQQADTLNRSLNARAFTTGKDIFFGKGEYQPKTFGGKKLLAHELTHTVQQGAADVQRSPAAGVGKVSIGKMAANRISTKKKSMHLDFVKMKRQDPDYDRIIKKKLGIAVAQNAGGGTYGHWWTEVGDGRDGGFYPRQSYGWWPGGDDAPTGKRLWGGVPGELNGGQARDPHHGEDAPVEFHPTLDVDLAKENYDQIKARVSQEIDTFANNFTGNWNWKLGWGKNCHTFQQKMKTKLGLHYKKSAHWLVDPKIQQAQDDRERAKEEATQGVKFTVPDNATLARHSPENGSDLPGGYRSGTDIYATGKVLMVQTKYQGAQPHYEYIVGGDRNWISKVYWEMWFGNGSYPENSGGQMSTSETE